MTNEYDPRQLPTEEIKLMGAAIAQALYNDEFDKVVELCKAYFSELGFQRGKGLYFTFEPRKQLWDVEIWITGHSDLDDFEFEQVRMTGSHHVDGSGMETLGVRIILDLHSIILWLVRDFAEQLFFLDGKTKKKHFDAIKELLPIYV